ncbi:TIGR03084 family metal-binding protein [Actinomadura atramentaria]|uniref:TIGR03084 family metal-binding protein n=1 Tax=Actinomadura atramentaria TaxID=1990 RepID=UPI00035D1E94|nr:TIGR03084 family metal-binding protein [Actinomadura atramentaria]
MPDIPSLLADLDAESAVLDTLVAPLTADGWATPTPAEGWTVAHQITHLAWTDRQALLAATDPAAFTAAVEAAFAGGGFDMVDKAAEEGAARPAAEVLADWRAVRGALAAALAAAPAGTRLPWFGPPMGVATMATARLMETWAHGQDVADALGVVREPTARLRHVAHIGVRTRDFAFVSRGLTPPAEEFRIALTAPDGAEWTWGPADAAQSVTGPALDFCLLATRRRHPDDLAVVADGPDARAWLGIAQAFAGPAGTDPAPMRD